MTTNEAIKSAFEHYQSGNLERSEHICKDILRRRPADVDTMHFLGIICSQLGKFDDAVRYLKEASRLDRTNPYAYFHLGNAHQGKGEYDDAMNCYRQAIQLNPEYAEAYNNLGNVHRGKGEYDGAMACYQQAIQTDPQYAGAYYNLGNILQEKGQLDKAIASYNKAIELNPNDADAYNDLGVAFKDKGRLDEALDCYQKALHLDPEHYSAHHNRGYALMKQGRLEEATESYQSALRIEPDSWLTLESLGSALVQQGKLDEAETYYRCAIRINANYLIAHEALLVIMNYNSRYDAQTIFSEHLTFAREHAEPLSAVIPPHSNERSPVRRLRIGYVSPDFRRHSVAYFIEPVLASHNHGHCEIFCYSDVSFPDEVTTRIQGYADHWQNILGKSDEVVARLIQRDSIDILVDLAGHTANNRVLVFARKPAPVQVSWVGYLATTGFSAMDYRIADRYTDPPGTTEQFYTEKLMRLPQSFLCYLPDKDSPVVGDLPAQTSGHITFGSFNNLVKVSPGVFALWARILKALPESCLIMKARSLSDRSTRQYAMEMFTQEGVTAERIVLLPWDPSPKHLMTYNEVDIGLDTFPFNGGTTTCEALWMGVPVITLAGTAYASRTGVSLLSNVGLADLIACTPERYVEIAVNLAKDINRLQTLRRELRSRVAHSPLTNAKQFTDNLEKCYREVWARWCRAAQGGG